MWYTVCVDFLFNVLKFFFLNVFNQVNSMKLIRLVRFMWKINILEKKIIMWVLNVFHIEFQFLKHSVKILKRAQTLQGLEKISVFLQKCLKLKNFKSSFLFFYIYQKKL